MNNSQISCFFLWQDKQDVRQSVTPKLRNIHKTKPICQQKLKKQRMKSTIFNVYIL